MQNVRNLFINQFVSWIEPSAQTSLSKLGRLKGPGSPESEALRKKLKDWATDVRNRRTVLLMLWVILVFLLTSMTAIGMLVSHWMFRNYRFGIILSVVLWAFTFGIAVLFFLSAKTVTTVFGGLLGVSVDSATSGAGLLDKANQMVLSVSQQLATSFGINTVRNGGLVRDSVWLFVIILMVTCLPAFFSDTGKVRET